MSIRPCEPERFEADLEVLALGAAAADGRCGDDEDDEDGRFGEDNEFLGMGSSLSHSITKSDDESTKDAANGPSISRIIDEFRVNRAESAVEMCDEIVDSFIVPDLELSGPANSSIPTAFVFANWAKMAHTCVAAVTMDA